MAVEFALKSGGFTPKKFAHISRVCALIDEENGKWIEYRILNVENAIKEECSDDQTATEKECTSDENDKDCKKKGKLNDRAYKVKGKDESKRQHLN